MLQAVLLFALGLMLLIKGGDWLIDGAAGIAHRFHVPEFLIGATVISIGTTIPEVMVSATSALQGHGEICYGNALGSIICNTALIAAITIAVRPGKIDRNAIKIPVLFFFIAAVFYCGIAYTSGTFSRISGVILLAIFMVYILLSVNQAKRKSTKVSEEYVADSDPLYKMITMLVVGAVLIAFGADLLVDNGIIIAEVLGVPEAVIGLTFVAIGTSLPELVAAVTSLVKGHSDLSLGNVIGANLFNLVLVSGVSATLAPFQIPASKTIGSMNSSLVVDIPVMLVVMLLLCIPAMKKERLYRLQGILLLTIYIAFCAFQFVSA